MKIALFGGSFNPPHNGHVAVAKALADSGDFDQVWVLPSYSHPFGKVFLPFEERFRLCELAFGPLAPRVRVDPTEKQRGEATGYTIDTVRYLRQRHPEDEFFLVMGSDLFGEVDRWKDYEELKKLVSIYPVARAGYEESRFPKVASSEIRERIRQGGEWRSLLPEKVGEYIRKKGLYS
ncbi:MAG: nicotinate-nicotinamide nucleotide adenylyltransferase [bacterium]